MSKVKISFLTLIMLLIISACTQNQTTVISPSIVSKQVESLPVNNQISVGKKIVKDSLIILDDSLFTDIKLKLIEISKDDFQYYKKSYKTNCEIDSGGSISGAGLHIVHDCNEICDTYLAEDSTNRKLLLPSGFDAGVMWMLLSPSCNQMIIGSSYDGPDFEEYYNYRSEFSVFNINAIQGLKGVYPKFDFNSKNWSIDDVTWIDENSIALKTYSGRHSDNENVSKFKYFKAIFRK